MVKIAVLGYGTVGSGVVEVLTTNRESIARKAGEEIDIKYVLDLRDFPGDPIQEKIVHDYQVILDDEEVRVVVEVMGGIEPAFTFVKQALMAGKNVATSNKELVARHGAELIAIARENSVNFMFEASVGGGIPIIRPLLQSLTADEIVEISGILNGTTNYMLTKMSEQGLAYDIVLKNAQDKGYAERNPAADVEGYDACRKIAILASLAYAHQVDFEDIYTEGISKITDTDFVYAKKLGLSIKLLAVCKRQEDKVLAMVSPMMIGPEHPLFNVNNVFNAIFVKGNMLGDAMFYGRGAGKLPTASAVVADVVEEIKHIHTNIRINWSREKLELADMKAAAHRFFVRISGMPEEKGAQVKALFGDVDMIQVKDGEFGIVTPQMKEKDFDEKAAALDGMITRIRGEF
ncbi:MAG TPA: homoserine dehydrogenase [Candidatus Scybalocola faecigallinarum]|uniref:Homoserine dehydrogenase n=1 Tax=Candidatus Scybalocola faecigallinarum TaxID=2840941 RepID=A0A9D1F6K4_9FIRM|nr:homoserine dehydrogenase [Candidatus Scybalocola faecigallinarum]